MDEKIDEKSVPRSEACLPDHDNGKGSIDNGIDPRAEKKLLRKIDLNLITLFGALYLMSFLGRSFQSETEIQY